MSESGKLPEDYVPLLPEFGELGQYSQIKRTRQQLAEVESEYKRHSEALKGQIAALLKALDERVRKDWSKQEIADAKAEHRTGKKRYRAPKPITEKQRKSIAAIAAKLADEAYEDARDEERQPSRADAYRVPSIVRFERLDAAKLPRSREILDELQAQLLIAYEARIRRGSPTVKNPRRSSEGRAVTFTLTKRETKMYDSGDARTWHDFRRDSIMPKVRAELAKGRSVTIETFDGITIDTFNPSDHG